MLRQIKRFFSSAKNRAVRPLYALVPVVALAFILMVILSYRFMSDIEHNHMIRDVNDVMATTESRITADLFEIETFLGSIAETVRIMILRDESADAVKAYLAGITDYFITDNRILSSATVAYGYFDIFNGAFLTGNELLPPDGYEFEERPWFKAAVEANGKVAITDPFMSLASSASTLSFSRRIFDNEGRPLGIVVLDVTLERLRRYAVETYVTEGGYGILLDRHFNVIAHPHPAYIGRSVREMNDGPAVEEQLRRGKNIVERIATDYRGDTSILFVNKLENGWYLAILIYAKHYYAMMRRIARILIILGAGLTVIVSAILIRIVSDKYKSDERMQTMFDAMPLGANFWNTNYELIDCSQEAVRLFGLSKKQDYLDRFFELSPAYQSGGMASELLAHEAIKKAFNEGYYRFEWMHQNLNEEPVPCEITLVRVKYRGGNIVVGYTRDLREYKALHGKIHEQNEKLNNLARWYENILDTIPFPISVTDADMNWTFINKATENHLEVERDDVMGLPCDNWRADICHTERCGIDRLKRGIKQTHFKQKGASFQVDGDILRNSNGETEGYVEVVQDITRLEQMTKRQAEAEAASRAKSDFLARVSHEIRTPMNAILGITEIQLQNEEIPPGAQEAFSKIYHSGYLLLGIINDILDLSKIEAGKLELVPVQYDVPSLINDTVQLNTARYDSKPINFILEIDENIPSTMFGDELRIKQILNNLLSNAFKYTDEGEIVMSVTTEPAAEPENSGQASDGQASGGQKSGEEKPGLTLVFRLSDTGRGMTQEQVDQLFVEYTRFDMVANRTTEGTGLGMNITRHLVQMMNGEILAESEPGKGSVFTVRLPQGVVGDDVLGKEVTENLKKLRLGKATQLKKAPQVVREYMPYGKVLVVDDVETNLYVAKGLMSPYGLTIDTAASGFEAVEKIKNGDTYDIIFMDHFMPKMDGIEATKIIRELKYEHPVIALTANALTGQAEMFMENGFDGFISKPIDIRQLNAILNKLIRNKYPQDVVEAARRLKDSRKGADDGVTVTDGDMLFLREKLVAVQEACAALDKKTAKDTLIELKRKSWPRPIKELLNTVAEHLLQGNLEEAANLARDFDKAQGGKPAG